LSKILHIDSSTRTCSVVLAVDGKCLSFRESHDQQYSHSEKLVVFIDEVLNDAQITAKQLDAVCVASGPGSYTGLRIGVSAAKGLCYALDVPFLSVSSLESMAHWLSENYLKTTDGHLLCPMIDARRMEVYQQQFSSELSAMTDISAEIIVRDSFSKQLANNKMIFFGDGAAKCKDVIESSNAVFLDDFLPSARGMIDIAEKKFDDGDFEDVAYFEPYYLKDFVAGKPKKIF
jgi:tRNA threonylcarbamoyladenosine biosynthesis protein TsaB